MTTIRTDDLSLARSARLGDEAAFVELVSIYQEPIFRLCYRMLGDAAEAEDAAQETFLRAYRHLPSYRPARPFRAWLFAIAAHYCIDCLRRRRPATLPLELEQGCQNPALRVADLNPEGEALREESRAQFQALLARLTPKDRDVIVMHYWGAMSYCEIARATGASPEAVKSRLHRARTCLAKMLPRTPTLHPQLMSGPPGAD